MIHKQPKRGAHPPNFSGRLQSVSLWLKPQRATVNIQQTKQTILAHVRRHHRANEFDTSGTLESKTHARRRYRSGIETHRIPPLPLPKTPRKQNFRRPSPPEGGLHHCGTGLTKMPRVDLQLLSEVKKLYPHPRVFVDHRSVPVPSYSAQFPSLCMANRYGLGPHSLVPELKMSPSLS